jgi:hypothetical protein
MVDLGKLCVRFLIQGCSREHFCILMLKRNGGVSDFLPTGGLAKESQTLKSHLQTGDLASPFGPDVQRGNLPLSYRLLREMGGLLSFAQEGRGRVFTVALPKKFLQEEKPFGLLPSDETDGQFGKFLF